MVTPYTAAGPTDDGFTLVEMLIVLMILAILGTMAIPSMNANQSEAVASTLMANVNNVAIVIEHQAQKNLSGGYPPELLADWFLGNDVPRHPEWPVGIPMVETVFRPGAVNPEDVVLSEYSRGAYWYNAANGVFRARVAYKGSQASTIVFYDKVNQTGAGPDPAPQPGGGAAPQPTPPTPQQPTPTPSDRQRRAA